MTRTGRPSRLLLFALAATFVAAAPAVARAKPTIEADLSTETLAVGEQAVYTLTVTDAMGGELTLPRFGDLHAVGPDESMQTAITIINGSQTLMTSKVYSWSISAPREGRFVIGAATLRHNGESFTSNTADLRCEGQAMARPRTQRRNPWGNGFADPFADLNDGLNRHAATGEGDVFLRAVVDKEEAFLGEQVTLSLYLYSQTDVAGVTSVSFPKLDGFWAEDLEAPTQLTAEIKNIKGIPYRAYLLRRRALFPLRAGELVVDAVEAQVNLGLAMFWGAPQDSVKRRSTALKLVIKPLPADGQPPAFEASNVGELSLTAKATPQRLPLGQPVQLKVVLEGVGNLKGVQVPGPRLPAGLKTYDPTVTDKVRLGGGRYGGTRTLEWVIIPERTGAFVIPPLEIPYFNPGRGAYDVARTPPLDLEVTAPPEGAPVAHAGAGTSAAAPTVSNVLTGGLRPIRLGAELGGVVGRPVWQRPWFWPLAGGPVALWALLWSGGAFVGMLRRRDPERLKVRRARGQAGKRLKAAHALVLAQQPREFYAEVVRALQQFLTDKLGVPALGLTRDELLRRLADKGVPTADSAALAQLFDTCEHGRFAPTPSGADDLARTLEEASRLIGALDGLKPGRVA